MPARQARRPRRAVAPSSLPRPSATGDATADIVEPAAPVAAAAPAPAPRSTRRPLGVRAHHVTEDYRYVRKDLVMVAVVAAISLGFVVGMSFLF